MGLEGVGKFFCEGAAKTALHEVEQLRTRQRWWTLVEHVINQVHQVRYVQIRQALTRSTGAATPIHVGLFGTNRRRTAGEHVVDQVDQIGYVDSVANIVIDIAPYLTHAASAAAAFELLPKTMAEAEII